MGNCNRKEIDEEEDANNNIQDKLMADLQFLKMKYTKQDSFGEFLLNIVPQTYLKDISHFKSVYRIKKNMKCQRDIMYNVRVIENVNSGRLFNVKMIKRSEIFQLGMDRFKAMFANEMRALSHFKHPHLENLIDVYYEKKPDSDFTLFVVTDFTTRESLMDLINKQIANKRRFEDKEIAQVMKNLIETVYKFKTEKFIHRNLCPENIFFLKEGSLKTICIRNYYFSTFTETNPKVRGLTGPLCYMAPEMLQDQFYDSKVDIWSLGIIFYMLLTLEHPFRHVTHRDEILELVKTDKSFRKVKDLRKVGINSHALTLNFKMLLENQDLRISPEMLLEDEFFNEFVENVDKSKFMKYLIFDEEEIMKLKFKIENLPKLHTIVFYLFFHLSNYFIEIDELFELMDLYKFFDKNKDGLIKKTEIEEIMNKELLNDPSIEGFTKNHMEQYLDIFVTVVDNEFFKTFPVSLNNSYSYEFFITTNLLIKFFIHRDSDELQKKIEIMFSEMDLDKNGTISLDELQSLFHDVVNKDHIKKTVKIICEEPSYDNIISDFDEMTLQDLKNFLFYECVLLTQDQKRLLGMDKKEKSFNKISDVFLTKVPGKK